MGTGSKDLTAKMNEFKRLYRKWTRSGTYDPKIHEVAEEINLNILCIRESQSIWLAETFLWYSPRLYPSTGLGKLIDAVRCLLGHQMSIDNLAHQSGYRNLEIEGPSCTEFGSRGRHPLDTEEETT